MYELRETDVQPDVVCYDALINAYGWSTVKGKGRKTYEIFQKTLHLYESGKNRFAKPDIIMCNSVINAICYDTADTDSLETFQSNTPKFGYPNHVTYANVLLAIAKHMPPGDKRSELAEASFWQCCEVGQVSVLVVAQLHLALPWDRFAQLMGPALKSEKNEALGYNWNELPTEWTRMAPKRLQRRDSRPSKRHPSVKTTRLLIDSTTTNLHEL
jgi:hypothetical protein